MEKKAILYYQGYRRLNKHYNGEAIHIFDFIDLETLEKVSLAESFYNVEVSKIIGGKVYENILDARYDYDIIWNIHQNTISPIRSSIQEVKLKYELLKTKISDKNVLYNELINSITITKGNTYKIK